MGRGAAFAELGRPGNVVLAFVGVVVGGLAAVGREPPWTALLLAGLAGALGVAGGNALNDGLDAVIDRSAHPRRPVARGVVSPSEAVWWGASLVMAALLTAGLVNFWTLLLGLLLAGNLLLYELLLKRLGLAGHFLVSYNAGALFLLGGLAALAPVFTFVPDRVEALVLDERLVAPLVMAVLAMLLNLARELYKSAEDATHDALARSTFAVRVGPVRARRVGDVLAWVVVPFALWPWFLGLFPDVYLYSLMPLIVVLLVAPFLGSARAAQNLLKVGMVLGFLPFLATALI